MTLEDRKLKMSLTRFFYVKNFNSRAEICDKIIDSVNMLVKFSQCIDDGTLPIWKTKPAPPLAINYWKLKVFKKIFS